jgi:hypothetical protein
VDKDIVTYPSDPVFPTNSNFSQAVSDGWFLMLEPLKPRKLELKFSASQLGAGTTVENTALDVIITLPLNSGSAAAQLNPIKSSKIHF